MFMLCTRAARSSSVVQMKTLITLLAVLSGCVVDIPGEEVSSVEQLDASDSKTALEQAAAWASAFSPYATAAKTVIDFARSLGGGESPEDRILRLVIQNNALLLDIKDMIVAAGGTAPETQVGADLSKAMSASNQARTKLQTYGYVPADYAALYDNDSYNAARDLMTNAALWQRIYTERITHGEWLTITTARPEIRDNKVWDYRWALPALMSAIAMRINVIVALDSDRLKGDTYDTELDDYRNKLIEVSSTLENSIACGYAIAIDLGWGSPQTPAYHVHAICGDPFTGQEQVTVVEVADMHPYDYYWTDFWGGRFDVFASNNTYVSLSGVRLLDLRNRLWPQLASENLPASYALSEALAANRAKLRTRLGLFEMRRMIDALATIKMHDPGPLSFERLRAAYTNICLSHRLAFGPDIDYAVTATCDTPSMNTYGQTWWWDATNGFLQNQSTGSCLAILGDRPYYAMQSATIAFCDYAQEGQRWSYDPLTHRMRNMAGMVLDITNGNTAPGADTWTYWDTGNAAQQWGFLSPYTTTTTGTGGPHL
jgi:hypothetical protein